MNGKNEKLPTEQEIIDELVLRALETKLLSAPWKIGEPKPNQEWLNAYGEEMLGKEF